MEPEILYAFNLLSLDMDAGASEVNILNRLHFMIISAKEEMVYGHEPDVQHPEHRYFHIPRSWPMERVVLDNYLYPDLEKWRTWVSGLGCGKRQTSLLKNINKLKPNEIKNFN